MLTHGYGNRVYEHYSMALWPGNSNFSISSLYLVLRTFKKTFVNQLKVLFQAPPHSSFFEALLHRNSKYSSSIPNSHGCDYIPFPPLIRPTILLPKRFYL
jgi:hypothetical protein